MDVKSMSQGSQPAVDLNYSSANDTNAKFMKISSGPQGEDRVSSKQNCSKQHYEPGQKQIGEKEVKDAVDKLNKLFEGKDTHVEYELIGKSKHISIKIINDDTKEVIKEIPPKKIVEMIDKLCELAGIMVDEKA